MEKENGPHGRYIRISIAIVLSLFTMLIIIFVTLANLLGS